MYVERERASNSILHFLYATLATGCVSSTSPLPSSPTFLHLPSSPFLNTQLMPWASRPERTPNYIIRELHGSDMYIPGTVTTIEVVVTKYEWK